MTEESYKLLKASGFLWELYPELTGNWEKDKYDFFGYGDNNMEQGESL